MNKTERSRLTSLLRSGDVAGALLFLAEPAPVRPAAAAPCAKRPSRPNKFAPAPTLLGVAPCGCACWLDQAVMCSTCVGARNEGAVRRLLDQHGPAICEHERALFPYAQALGKVADRSRPRNWTAFIFQAACRYQHCG